METVQQNGRFTLFSSKFPSNIYSILFVYSTFQYVHYEIHAEVGKYDTVHNSYIKYVWLSLTIHVSILFYVNFKYVVLSIQISMRIFMAILSMFFCQCEYNVCYIIYFFLHNNPEAESAKGVTRMVR